MVVIMDQRKYSYVRRDSPSMFHLVVYKGVPSRTSVLFSPVIPPPREIIYEHIDLHVYDYH